MARSNLMRDLFTIAFKLPWWVSLALAATTFFLFRYVAAMDVSIEPGQGRSIVEGVGGDIVWTVVVSISFFLQFLIPGILVIGAVAGILKQRQGDSVLEHTKDALKSDSKAKAPPFESLSWQEFEMLLSAAFRARGYRVVQALPGPDGGVDLTLSNAQGKTLVQCKHWRSRKVGVSVVRELLGSMTVAGVKAGIIVCSGKYTQQAYGFARSTPGIQLIDGAQLKAMLREGMDTEGLAHQEVEQPTPKTLSCPLCQSRMIKRTAKKGQNAGNQFLGCSQFPKCRGVRPL